MTKKVGIITFHASHNCGSMMQAFALQTVLERMGAECEVIDFSNEGQRRLYALQKPNDTVKDFLKNIIFSLYKRRIRRNYDNYERFKKEKFHLTSKEFSKTEQLSDEKYDVVITGSDQVWNITIDDSDIAYFLPWVKNAKKVAYAPSFGAKNPERYAANPEVYRGYLEDFDSLSIREENGRKWLKSIVDKDVPVLLDPTLLLQVEDYDRIALKSLKLPERYIFYYAPGYTRTINCLVKQIAKKYKMSVIAFNTKTFLTKGMQAYGFQLPEIEDPSAYLQLISQASMVVTTSFHGTVFSSIYKKTFWTVKNGAMFGDDDRVKTLMDQIGLNDRMISETFDSTKDYQEPPDYKIYENKIPLLQKQAYQYIREAVGVCDDSKA